MLPLGCPIYPCAIHQLLLRSPVLPLCYPPVPHDGYPCATLGPVLFGLLYDTVDNRASELPLCLRPFAPPVSGFP